MIMSFVFKSSYRVCHESVRDTSWLFWLSLCGKLVNGERSQSPMRPVGFVCTAIYSQVVIFKRFRLSRIFSWGLGYLLGNANKRSGSDVMRLQSGPQTHSGFTQVPVRQETKMMSLEKVV